MSDDKEKKDGYNKKKTLCRICERNYIKIIVRGKKKKKTPIKLERKEMQVQHS